MLDIQAEADPRQEANIAHLKKVHLSGSKTPPALCSQATWGSLQGRPLMQTVEDLYLREQLIKSSAWCILTEEAATILGRFLVNRRVVEVFAGNGYLAHHLRQAAGLSRRQYRAYDNGSSHKQHAVVRYPGVTQKNAFMAPIKQADVIVMTWPPYATNHAERIAKKMRPGQYLVYNGEGHGGCTGNDAFHKMLDSHFKPMKIWNRRLDDKHATHPFIHDRWTIWEKIA